MNYNEIFNADVNMEFFYNKAGYPKKLLVNGYLDLDKALKRLDKGEYYVLVSYHKGEDLPDCYLTLPNELLDFELPDGLALAIFNANVPVTAFCKGFSIQLITRLPNSLNGAVYLLGPGPDKVCLEDIVSEQLQNYKEKYCSHSR